MKTAGTTQYFQNFVSPRVWKQPCTRLYGTEEAVSKGKAPPGKAAVCPTQPQHEVDGANALGKGGLGRRWRDTHPRSGEPQRVPVSLLSVAGGTATAHGQPSRSAGWDPRKVSVTRNWCPLQLSFKLISNVFPHNVLIHKT